MKLLPTSKRIDTIKNEKQIYFLGSLKLCAADT
jgi:hypothetical protein